MASRPSKNAHNIPSGTGLKEQERILGFRRIGVRIPAEKDGLCSMQNWVSRIRSAAAQRGIFARPALCLSALKPAGKPLPDSLDRLLPKSTVTLAETQRAHVGSGKRAPRPGFRSGLAQGNLGYPPPQDRRVRERNEGNWEEKGENTRDARAQWAEGTVQRTPALHYTGLLENPFSNSELRTSLRA